MKTIFKIWIYVILFLFFQYSCKKDKQNTISDESLSKCRLTKLTSNSTRKDYILPIYEGGLLTQIHYYDNIIADVFSFGKTDYIYNSSNQLTQINESRFIDRKHCLDIYYKNENINFLTITDSNAFVNEKSEYLVESDSMDRIHKFLKKSVFSPDKYDDTVVVFYNQGGDVREIIITSSLQFQSTSVKLTFKNDPSPINMPVTLIFQYDYEPLFLVFNQKGMKQPNSYEFRVLDEASKQWKYYKTVNYNNEYDQWGKLIKNKDHFFHWSCN